LGEIENTIRAVYEHHCESDQTVERSGRNPLNDLRDVKLHG
jgi:hypothetical protein